MQLYFQTYFELKQVLSLNYETTKSFIVFICSSLVFIKLYILKSIGICMRFSRVKQVVAIKTKCKFWN